MKFIKTFENMELKEHDVVTLKKDIVNLLRQNHTIPAGTKGTVVYVYDNGSTEVEFVIDDKSYVEFLSKNEVEK